MLPKGIARDTRFPEIETVLAGIPLAAIVPLACGHIVDPCGIRAWERQAVEQGYALDPYFS